MALPSFLRPSGRFAVSDRRIVFLLGIVAFAAGYTGSEMAHTLPFARQTLGLSEGAMSSIFAAVRAASLLGVGFAVVADRRGRRRPLIAAFTLLAIASMLTAFLPTPLVYGLSQAAVRIAIVAIAGLGVVFLAEEVTPAVRGYGIGLYGLAGSLGVGTGLLILPLAERAEEAWRILFALGGLGLLAVPLLLRYLPESKAFRAGTPISFITALRIGLGKHFWPLAAASFLIAAFSAPAFDFVLERLIDDLGWQAGAARFLLIIASGLGAAGLIVGGRAADRIGRRPTAVAGMIIGVIGGVGFYLLDSGWFLAPSVFLATLGATMLTPALGAMRAELFPTKVRATAAGWVTNVAIMGSIAGFVVGGFLIDELGLSITVAILAVGVVGAVPLILRLPETKGMDIVRLPSSRRRAGAAQDLSSGPGVLSG